MKVLAHCAPCCLLYNTKNYTLSPKIMCQLVDAFVGSIHNLFLPVSLLINFANILKFESKNVGPDLGPNCLTL